jgi:hypothetical protein
LVGFGVNLLFFSSFLPFFHFSFFFGLRVGHAKSYINPSISFFFWFGHYYLNCNCFNYIYYLLFYFIFGFIHGHLISLIFFNQIWSSFF